MRPQLFPLVAGAALALDGQLSATLAGRPLFVDDAEPVATGALEIEAGLHHVGGGPGEHGDFPIGLTYGVAPRLEAGVGFGPRRVDTLEGMERGHGDVTLSSKWKIFTQEQAWADHSLSGTIKIPTADEDRGLGSGEWDYTLQWVATRELGERWSADLNVGYIWLGGASDTLQYGLAAHYTASEKVELVAEIVSVTSTRNSEDDVVLVNAGVRWSVHEALTLDAAIGTGIHGDTAPDILATVGLTWTLQLRKSRK